MAAITLERARQMLDSWLDAELAVTTGQSYQIGSRQVTRANASHIRQQVAYWRREVERLEKGRSGARVMRVVPRDL
jgi:hypothetical protein